MRHVRSLVLASASPRRRQLLAYLGVQYRSVSTTGEDEERPMPQALARRLPEYSLNPVGHPTLLAWRKCDAAREICSGVLLGADTIVVIDGEVLGKPRDADHAVEMLQRLRGRQHTVYTGVALVDSEDGGVQLALDQAQVTMTAVDDRTIAEYVATGEPMDKAGAYGIQGLGGRLVTHVEGSFSCVIGLPLTVVHSVLSHAGFSSLVDPHVAFERWRVEHGKDGPPCTAP